MQGRGRKISDIFRPIVEPIVDTVDRAAESAAIAAVRHAGEKNGFERPKETISVRAQDNNPIRHQESLKVFLNRKWKTNLHRRRSSQDRKRTKLMQNRCRGRPHG